jgi:hypothetical protein
VRRSVAKNRFSSDPVFAQPSKNSFIKSSLRLTATLAWNSQSVCRERASSAAGATIHAKIAIVGLDPREHAQDQRNEDDGSEQKQNRPNAPLIGAAETLKRCRAMRP